jgi:hypothetical protein
MSIPKVFATAHIVRPSASKHCSCIFFTLLVVLLALSLIPMRRVSEESFDSPLWQSVTDVSHAGSHPVMWNATFTAVACEPRPDPRFVSVVAMFSVLLPLDWQIVVFHSASNQAMLMRLAEKLPKGKLLLNVSYFGTASNANANSYLTDKQFWTGVPGEKILLFQMDSILCSGTLHNLFEFIEYDFIGAPWPHLKHLGSGNGGLSLRTKSCMIRVLEKRFSRNDNEDVFYSLHMKDVGCRVAPIEIAAKFSVELWFLDRAPLGVHAAYKYLKPHEINELKRVCPEIRLLLD